jgi:hypothetical protein
MNRKLICIALSAALHLPAMANTPSSSAVSPETRTPVTLPALRADKLSLYVGQYAIDDRVVVDVAQQQASLSVKLPGRRPERLLSRGNGQFTGKYIALEFPPTKGPAPKLIVRRYGLDIEAPRVTPERAAQISSQIQQRTLALQAAQPDSTVRDLIAQVVNGAPRYEQFTPTFSRVMQRRIGRMQPFLTKMGPLHSIELIEVGPLGMDIYRAVFERGTRRIFVSTDAAGRVSGFLIRLPE